MPSTDRKLELTAKASMAQPVSQPAVCCNGLTLFSMSAHLVTPQSVLNIIRRIVLSGPHDGGSLPICVFDLPITSRISTKFRAEILCLSSHCDPHHTLYTHDAQTEQCQ